MAKSSGKVWLYGSIVASLLGAAGYYIYNISNAYNQVTANIKGVKINFSKGNASAVITLLLSNPSVKELQLKSLTGTLSLNSILLGNVVLSKPVLIPAKSSVISNITITLPSKTLLSAAGSLIQSAKKITGVFKGIADIGVIRVPLNFEYPFDTASLKSLLKF